MFNITLPSLNFNLTLPMSYAKPLLIASAGTVGTVAILRYAFKRRWWCQCGGSNWWSDDINGRHNSQHIMDAYSFTHFLHGVVFYVPLTYVDLSIEYRAALAFLAEATWEVVENSPPVINMYRSGTASSLYEGDSIANSLSDCAACVLGFAFAANHSWQVCLATGVAIELILLHEIRDNLTLNVIMLICPIPAIRRWQQRGAKRSEVQDN